MKRYTYDELTRYMHIYLIENKKTKLCYIGKTIDLVNRIKTHAANRGDLGNVEDWCITVLYKKKIPDNIIEYRAMCQHGSNIESKYIIEGFIKYKKKLLNKRI